MPVGPEDVRGYVFDLDGTLVQRTREGLEVIPGAAEVLAALRTSGRPFVVFTNASHVAPEAIARELRDDGLDVRDDEVLTPVCSALTFLRGRHAGRRVFAFASKVVRDRLTAGGVTLLSPEDADQAEAIFVATPEQFDLVVLDRVAHAIAAGAPLFTSSYVPAYSGANGPIFSRGAMVTAALSKVTGARPVVLGKPSKAAVGEIVDRMGIPSSELAVVGDDVGLEVALGHLGGSHTILVRSGISGSVDPARLPKSRRPHEVVDGVSALLDRL
jgi:HAD superfamily hydrolase (TIGR01450 family)